MHRALTLPIMSWRRIMADPAGRSRAVLAAGFACLLAVSGYGCAGRPLAASGSSISKPDPSSQIHAASGTEGIAGSHPQEHPDEPISIIPPSTEESEGPSSNSYLNRLIAEAIGRFAAPQMSEYEAAKAAFDYMIENTVMDEPIGLELWRLYSPGDSRLSFVENRSLSVLQYGVGMCEDYAAALTMLLRGLGMEAEYVPGLTYSLEGHLVDHAWTMAKIDGVWYHLDCQLEDNISRHGAVRYRYFMRGDESISASHMWGQRLVNSGLLTAGQNAEIMENFFAETCPGDYPRPEQHPLAEKPAPDIQALRAQAETELSNYEAEHGELMPMELDIIPPVFGVDGFGPPDEG